ncbi:chloride channel protein [uncultured Haemophilus sp.]|uniref:chloride channel protein n=1 Tax=uncultured Haemophilus sp. TaxID=237779 RepID=UPI0035A6DAEE
MACLTWFTKKYTPYVGGSGIPQVIASINLPHSSYKTKLVEFSQTIWKIPLTFLAMLIGVSVGRKLLVLFLSRFKETALIFHVIKGQHRFLVSIFGLQFVGWVMAF